jgi:pyridoxine/pyridoxamine 5'-phosphate oxidase
MRKDPARWRTVEARLGREMTIWIATVRDDGRPHLTPVWYVWLDDRVFIAIGASSVKFANLHLNRNVSLALPDTDRVIILEGLAQVAEERLSDKLAEYFFNKYEWDFRYDDTADWRLVEIHPGKILAWGDGYDHEGIRVR